LQFLFIFSFIIPFSEVKMHLSTIFINALVAARGFATALPKQHHAKLTDVGVMGEISQIPEDEIAPADSETLFSEHTSPNH
jgi:hypothetical protein